MKLLIALAATLVVVATARADLICAKNKVNKRSGKVSLQTSTVPGDTCPKGFTKLLDLAALSAQIATQGPVGPPGTPGRDGDINLYGDGSAGVLNVEDDSGLALNDSNLNYSDVVIAPGATLSLAPGSVVRCTGTFTNNGTLEVFSGTAGFNGFVGASSLTSIPVVQPPGSTFALAPASVGEIGDDTAVRKGGKAGHSIGNAYAARSHLSLPFTSCGGGAGGGNSFGGAGGGVVTILCKEGIVNNGSIEANGGFPLASAGGGGSGGIVILGSAGSIFNSGTISAIGRPGGVNSGLQGRGGGGGGGIVHFVAPQVENSGNVDVAAGGIVAPSGTVTNGIRQGGSGGGSCGGLGGVGGDVATNDTSNNPGGGSSGLVLTTLLDPAGLA